MEQKTKDNLTSRNTWMRVVYMILFAVIFNIVEFVIAVVAVVQFLSTLFTGKVIRQLQALGQSVGAYVNEITQFLTYRTDDKPYPFAAWPKGTPGAGKATRAKPQRTPKGKAGGASGPAAKTP